MTASYAAVPLNMAMLIIGFAGLGFMANRHEQASINDHLINDHQV
jgi:hypothetical protein